MKTTLRFITIILLAVTSANYCADSSLDSRFDFSLKNDNLQSSQVIPANLFRMPIKPIIEENDEEVYSVDLSDERYDPINSITSDIRTAAIISFESSDYTTITECYNSGLPSFLSNCSLII